jgi:hypothetical protein
MHQEPRDLRLSDRDWKILQHVWQHRLIDFAMLHQVFFPDQQVDAVKSTLRRLCGKPPRYRYLHPEPLDAKRVYYRLTPRAARLLGAPFDVARPLGPQARLYRYAVAWFIHVDGRRRRTLFNPHDFHEQFPVTGHRLPRSHFYIEDSADQPRLGYILVDHGAHVRRVVRKAVKVLGRFLYHGWFDEYIRDKAFVLTVLTFLAGKKASIERRLRPALVSSLSYHLTRLSAVIGAAVDLRELVMGCTCVKQFFSARDPWLQDYISRMSGTTKYFSLDYELHPRDVRRGLVGLPHGFSLYSGVTVQEKTGPKLTPQDIQDYSRQENLCIFAVEHAKGLTQVQGYFPMYVDWPTTESEYRRRRDQLVWPAASAATLEIQPDWPQPNADTVMPTAHPDPAADPGVQAPQGPSAIARVINSRTRPASTATICPSWPRSLRWHSPGSGSALPKGPTAQRS